MTEHELFMSVGIGVIATFVMDRIAMTLVRMQLFQPGPYLIVPKLLGRWILGFSSGRFYRPEILRDPSRPLEIRMGWIFHYAIGITLSAQYLLLCKLFGFNPGMPLLALAFGISTTILPWLLMFPALGFGVFARKTSREAKLPYFSLVNHFVYGLGFAVLYGVAFR